jgi:polyferredoxin
LKKFKKNILRFGVILLFGILPALICQFFTKLPTGRYLHVSSFRYGKDPSVIRCNRGDTLHITFSTKDTGHSFFLEEFDMDVKVSPAREEVTVFKTSDPGISPLITKEVTFIAKHYGVLNYLVAKSNFRCHVWCGPMHAFEQGKLIIFPNTLLVFSLGSLLGILVIFFTGIVWNVDPVNKPAGEKQGYKDLFRKSYLLRRMVISRWPQAIMIILTMLMIYIVILTSVFGTKVSGRNLGVLMMWTIWLFLLVVFLTPFGGRIWCTICPLPFFGDMLQRRSFFTPARGKTNGYHNKFFGLSLKWPGWLSNSWLRLLVFLILATFSTTLVAIPRISGLTVLMLVLVPTFMALVWELRAFCRYVCPVSAFVNTYSGLSPLALRNKSQKVCDQCKPHYCEKGSTEGWACPYGLNAGELKENSDCGLCLECTRSCLYNNVSLYIRPFGSESGTRNMSEAWLAIAIFTISIIYSILYLGHWPVIRDYVNIIDKNNWGLFGIYSLVVWIVSLLLIPGIIYLLSYIGTRLVKRVINIRNLFLAYSGVLLPLGLMLWIAFVISMLFVNKTFIIQSLSDPFGWGWDFFGTANIPWHQFMPQSIPWLQALAVLTGACLSLKNIKNSLTTLQLTPNEMLMVTMPMTIFISSVSAIMIIFFTN